MQGLDMRQHTVKAGIKSASLLKTSHEDNLDIDLAVSIHMEIKEDLEHLPELKPLSGKSQA